MTDHPQEIAARLRVLCGLPWWHESRALNLHMFDFGPKTTVTKPSGRRIQCGQYALHVQCAWRIIHGNRIIVGSRDRNHSRMGPQDIDSDFSWDEPRSTWCDKKLEDLLSSVRPDVDLVVERIVCGSAGAFVLYFGNGMAMEVFPDDSGTEQWRLMDFTKETCVDFVVSADDDD